MQSQFGCYLVATHRLLLTSVGDDESLPRCGPDYRRFAGFVCGAESCGRITRVSQRLYAEYDGL